MLPDVHDVQASLVTTVHSTGRCAELGTRDGGLGGWVMGGWEGEHLRIRLALP